jgi:hypothetical protein
VPETRNQLIWNFSMVNPALLATGIVAASAQAFSGPYHRQQIVDRLTTELKKYTADDLRIVNEATGAPDAEGNRVDPAEARATCSEMIKAVCTPLDHDHALDVGVASARRGPTAAASAATCECDAAVDTCSAAPGLSTLALAEPPVCDPLIAGDGTACADSPAELQATCRAGLGQKPEDSLWLAHPASHTRGVQPIGCEHAAACGASAAAADAAIHSMSAAPLLGSHDPDIEPMTASPAANTDAEPDQGSLMLSTCCA